MTQEKLVISEPVMQTPMPQLTPEQLQEQQKIVNETISKVETSIKITEADKAKLAKQQATQKTEEEEIAALQGDLADFLQDKIAINNEDGGVIDKFPTGIDVLDAVAGGGFGVGTFTMIVGNPGTFKSALLGSVIATGQKKYGGRMLTVYHDSETATSTERLSKLGVNNPKIKPYDEVTVESVFKSIEGVSAFKQLKNITDRPTIIAWDSIANTCTEKDKTTDDINQTMGLKQRMISGLFPRYLSKMKANKISLIAVNQLRDSMSIGPYGPPADLQHMGGKDIPGGQAAKFNAFHLLFLKNRGDLKIEQYGFSGIKLEAYFIKNKFFRPNVPVTLIVDFNTGVSNFWTNYNFLVDNGRMQAGAWNYLVALPNKKYRTKDVVELYATDIEYKKTFDKEVQDTIKREIVDKYS